MFNFHRIFSIVLLLFLGLSAACQPAVPSASQIESSVEEGDSDPTPTPIPPTSEPAPLPTATAEPTTIPIENAASGNELTKPRMVMFWSAY